MSSSRIGQRIVMSTQGDRWMATVSSEIPAWQRQSLELWFGAWVALGAMLAYGVISFPGSERTFYFICLGFWAFFAFRACRAVRWRRSGLEVIQLSPAGLELRNDHGAKRGRAGVHALKDVEPAAFPNPTLGLSWNPWNSSFGWSVATASTFPSKGKPTSLESNWNCTKRNSSRRCSTNASPSFKRSTAPLAIDPDIAPANLTLKEMPTPPQ